MARGPDERNGPQAVQPGSRPEADALAKGHRTNADILTDATGKKPGETRGLALPVAFASQAEPCAGRELWHAMYKCGACGGTHFARSREQLVTGKRRARCGRRVWLVIPRTYPAGTGTGAAA
jgi:hypothetical protein